LSHSQAQVIFVFGVSGSGKTTIGKSLAQRLGFPFLDGDDFHPASNKEKMASGVPLTDEDRKGWLVRINRKAVHESKARSVVIGCSALKESYRQQLMHGMEGRCKWFLLHGSYDLVLKRMQERTAHFMPTALLQSQFELLEIPQYAILFDIQLSEKEIVDLMLRHLK